MDIATLTTLVGLFSLWKGERRNTGQDEDQSFLEYLETHRFNQLKRMLEGNTDLLSEIQMQSDQNHSEIMSALELTQQMGVEMLSKMEHFQWVAEANKENEQCFSPQAMRILSGLYSKEQSTPFICQTHDGWGSSMKPEPIAADEQCFLEDDLKLLETAGHINIKPIDHGFLLKKTRQGLGFYQRLSS